MPSLDGLAPYFVTKRAAGHNGSPRADAPSGARLVAMSLRRIALLSTGGTIEKTYDELSGVLKNELSVLDVMLASLELRGVAIDRVRLMNKDSLDMTPEDHTLIANSVRDRTRSHDGVVVVHGTDRLAQSGDRCVEVMGTPRVPVVFTGAMRDRKSVV